jgi:hypothetical protein
MGSPESLEASVLVAAEVGPDEELAIVDAFAAVGVAASTRVVPARRAAAELQWLVLAALPLNAFLARAGAGLADDAGHVLEHLVGRVIGHRRRSAAVTDVLVLQDAATRLRVVLEADLPADAYRQLIGLDLSSFRRGPLHYDRQRGRWRSELDEARRRHVRRS